MSDHDAFLQAILENPDDDAPRLMYADWLTEHGDPRGEFIRIQIELAQMHAGERFNWLKEQEEALLKRHRADWVAPIDDLVVTANFHRGFVSEVGLAPKQFKTAERLFRLTPVQRLTFCPWLASQARSPVDITSSPLLAHLDAIDFGGIILGYEALRALAGSPHLGRLRKLYCSRSSMGSAEVEDLLSGPGLRGLTTLVLSFNRIDGDGLWKLADSPHVRHLEYLDLRGNRIDCRGVEALAASPLLGSLQMLDLAENRVADRGVLALVNSRYVTRKTTVVLGGNPLGSRVKAVVRSRFRDQVSF